MRQTLPSCGLWCPSCHRSLQVAASPCWAKALPDIISVIRAQAPGPLPRGVPPVHKPVSSRRTSASPQTSQVRHTNLPLPCNFHRESISGLQSFHYVQAPTLDRPPGCTHRSLPAGPPGRLHHAPLGWLPAPSWGIATYPNRATDTAGLSPAGLQPCRLLRHPISHDDV